MENIQLNSVSAPLSIYLFHTRVSELLRVRVIGVRVHMRCMRDNKLYFVTVYDGMNTITDEANK